MTRRPARARGPRPGTAPLLVGEYRDRVHGSHGVVVDTGWRANTIALQAWTVVAGLLRNDAAMRGVQYCAVGAGRRAWDVAPPGADQSAASLEDEIARAAIGPGDATYIDGFGRPSTQPTARIEVVAEFGWPQAQTLREFALVGGDATQAANTGRLINHVIHPPLSVPAGQTLTRRVRLSFRPGAARSTAGDNLPADSAVGALPSTAIDGVGTKVATALESANADTVDDVARLAIGQEIAGLRKTQLVELRAKARLALRTAAGIPLLTPLSGREVQSLLEDSPADIAAEAGLPLDVVQALQDQLGLLQVALDARRLRRMTLGELRG